MYYNLNNFNNFSQLFVFTSFSIFWKFRIHWSSKLLGENIIREFNRKNWVYFFNSFGSRPTTVKKVFSCEFFKRKAVSKELRASMPAWWTHDFNPLRTNPTKWSKTLKQFVEILPTNCLSVFEHFVRLALKGLIESSQNV